jgi:hypothetical protein
MGARQAASVGAGSAAGAVDVSRDDKRITQGILLGGEMSGGHFDYGCFRISQFADELQHEIETNDDQTPTDWGGMVGENLAPETVSRLKVAQAIIAKAGRLAREIEWLYSGDHSEESYWRLHDGIMGEP